MKNKFTAITSGLIGATLFITSTAISAGEVWKIQSHLPTGHLVYQAEQAWVNNVNVMLGGRLQLELLPGGAVVPQNETIDAIGYGIIDGDITTPAYFAGRDKGFAMLADLIGGYDDWTQAFAWCEFGGGKELFQKAYDKVNQNLLFLNLQKVGNGDLFYKNIKSMYNDVSYLVKVKKGHLNPLP